jgi:YfiH family protein
VSWLLTVPLIQHPLLAGIPGLRHGFSERGGGVSLPPFASLNLGPRSGDAPAHVRENRRRFLAALGLAGLPVLAPRQVHSAQVSVQTAAPPLPADGVLPGDAVVTNARGVAVMVLAADCVPLLLCDPGFGVIAAVHAGWRGTAGAIASRTVATMEERFGCQPERVLAVLGPAIGRCCYEVGAEVLAAVAHVTPGPIEAFSVRRADGKAMLDLAAANVAQLRAAGLRPEHIAVVGLCTACHPSRLFSHRRDGRSTGRGGAAIAWLP